MNLFAFVLGKQVSLFRFLSKIHGEFRSFRSLTGVNDIGDKKLNILLNTIVIHYKILFFILSLNLNSSVKLQEHIYTLQKWAYRI